MTAIAFDWAATMVAHATVRETTISSRANQGTISTRTAVVIFTFDQAHASSDGGAILLKAADRSLGLTIALAQALPDPRAATRVTHARSDVLAQRIFGISCVSDANDADGLAADPI